MSSGYTWDGLRQAFDREALVALSLRGPILSVPDFIHSIQIVATCLARAGFWQSACAETNPEWLHHVITAWTFAQSYGRGAA